MFEFFTITFVILLAAISPGPDFALVTRNALRYSNKIGVVTSLGVSVGILFHASYCILGFAIVISKSLLLFNIIKYVGAGYLIYIGVKGLLEKQTVAEVSSEAPSRAVSYSQGFFQGLLCNVLNPKAVMFFLALFTMLIRPSMPILMQVGYGIEIALIHFIWFSSVSAFFSHDKIKQSFGKFLHYITKIFGGALVGFGLKIATMTQR